MWFSLSVRCLTEWSACACQLKTHSTRFCRANWMETIVESFVCMTPETQLHVYRMYYMFTVTCTIKILPPFLFLVSQVSNLSFKILFIYSNMVFIHWFLFLANYRVSICHVWRYTYQSRDTRFVQKSLYGLKIQGNFNLIASLQLFTNTNSAVS